MVIIRSLVTYPILKGIHHNQNSIWNLNQFAFQLFQLQPLFCSFLVFSKTACFAEVHKAYCLKSFWTPILTILEEHSSYSIQRLKGFSKPQEPQCILFSRNKHCQLSLSCSWRHAQLFKIAERLLWKLSFCNQFEHTYSSIELTSVKNTRTHTHQKKTNFCTFEAKFQQWLASPLFDIMKTGMEVTEDGTERQGPSVTKKLTSSLPISQQFWF